MKGLYVFSAALLTTGIFTGCQTEKSSESRERIVSEEAVISGTQVEIKYAKGFDVAYFPGYRILSVTNPFEESADTVNYLLVDKGNPRPAGFEKMTLIETPVQKMIAMSSMHIGLLDFLDATSVLIGVDNLNYIYNEEVIRVAEQGKMAEVGRNMAPDHEKIISLQPDLLMGVGGTGPSQYHLLESAGIPVVINSEWVETTPLAKAEWSKLMAVLLNKEALVNERFAEIENEYIRLKALADQVVEKPKILTGINLKDVWYMPNGQNYMAVFLKDAGADYPLAGKLERGSSAMSFETVYPIAMDAVCWLNLGGMNLNTRSELAAQDKRYADFKAFKENRIFDYTKRINRQGANDFWESAGIRPDIVLADMIKILHPGLLPEHQLYYYKQLN